MQMTNNMKSDEVPEACVRLSQRIESIVQAVRVDVTV